MFHKDYFPTTTDRMSTAPIVDNRRAHPWWPWFLALRNPGTTAMQTPNIRILVRPSDCP